jgi:phosphate-selective porin OprO and OprP
VPALTLALLTQLVFAEEGASPLVPDRETEAYTSHPVDASGVVFKPGKGLSFKSEDGDFSLALGLRAMFLYEIENDPSALAPDPTTTQELMVRRARVTFGGTMWGKHNKYKIELAVSPKDESVDDLGYVTQTPLLTWQNSFTHLRDLELRIGQYKVPYSRERVVSSSKLAMVDRSSHNKAFNLDRDIGLDLGSRDLGGAGLFQYNVGVYAGEGRGRFEASDFGLMVLARLNVTPMGLFDDYEPQDFKRTGPRLSLGAAVAYVDGAQGAKSILDGAPEGSQYNHLNLTADALFKASGFSAEAAFALRTGADEPLKPFAEVGSGFYVQPGYLLPKLPIGIAARFAQTLPTEGTAMSEKTEVGPALSWYLAGARNTFKLQTDYLRSWGADGPAGGVDGARLQLQAML